MAALYEFTNLRELVGRGGGLVQRPAPSGEQHEAAANATIECLVFEATRKDMLRLGSSQFVTHLGREAALFVAMHATDPL
jgi:hypothetical protein